MSETQSNYNYKVVRQFAVMTVIWGIVGMLVGVIIAAGLARVEFWPLVVLRAIATFAYQRGDFCVWRMRAFCNILLHRATHQPCPPVLRSVGSIHLLGMATGYSPGGAFASSGLHDR